MSQELQSAENTISERISQLKNLADQIKDLKEEKEEAEGKRQDRKQKNEAFGDVKSEISDAEKTYNILCRAADLAVVLGAEIPQTSIEKSLDEYRPRLREFRSKRYDDFDNLSDIKSVKNEFEAFQEELNRHLDTIKDNLKSTANNELEEVETKETVLRIPDVGTEEESEKVSIYKRKLESVNQGQLIDADELKEAQQDYSEVDIDIATIRSTYGLSEDAGDLLIRFLKNETVTLADIDDGVLDELKKLEEFSERLTIQF